MFCRTFGKLNIHQTSAILLFLSLLDHPFNLFPDPGLFCLAPRHAPVIRFWRMFASRDAHRAQPPQVVQVQPVAAQCRPLAAVLDEKPIVTVAAVEEIGVCSFSHGLPARPQ